METKGWGSLEVEQAYDRAFELCRQVEQSVHLFPVLWGLHQVYMWQAKLDKAREMADQCLRLAQQAQDPALLLQAHHALWGILGIRSVDELPLALEHAEQGIAIYDPQQHHSQVLYYGGHDPGVCCRICAADALWMLGYPDQALKRGQEALDLGHALAHPMSLALAFANTAKVHAYRREAHAVAELAAAAIAIAAEKNFSEILAQAMQLQGWAMAEQGDIEQGLARLRQGIAGWSAAGADMVQPSQLAHLAESYQKADQIDQGLAAVTEALAAVSASGEGYYEAEIYRLRGELLLAAGHPSDQAEASYQQALQIARQQGAKSLELRAAVSLSRLWQRQGRHAEARQTLAAIYGWFSEGFDTPDLKNARSLLQQL
jgi:predicted ATPase